MDAFIGGSIGVLAGFISNPFEVVKARLQLQGELQKKGTYPIYYRNTIHGLKTIIKHEGYKGLYKGLIPALWFQFIYHSIRISTIISADEYGYLRKDPSNRTDFLRTMSFATLGAAFASLISSPFQLIKIRLQATSAPAIAVGKQHRYLSGMNQGLGEIFKSKGVIALHSGFTPAIPRTVFGAGIQISSYLEFKYMLIDKHLMDESSSLSTFVAYTVSAIFCTMVLSPFDVGVTRLCNQGLDKNNRGYLYKGLLDCFIKMFKTEGIMGFYKGILPCYIRLGPHAAFISVANDAIRRHRQKVEVPVVGA